MPANINSAYKKLQAKTRDLILLQTVEGIINWDMETMMPPRAVEQRSQQMALLSRIRHKMSVSKETGELLNAILKSPQHDNLGQIEKRNFHLIKKNYDEQTALPEELVAENAKQQAIAVNTWKKAKALRRFDLFKPELEKLVNLNRKMAEILMKVKQTASPYDALIDLYEPKMTAAAITTIFSHLQKGLRDLL